MDFEHGSVAGIRSGLRRFVRVIPRVNSGVFYAWKDWSNSWLTQFADSVFFYKHHEADLICKGKNIVLPGFDGNDINTSTNVQAYQTQINEAGIDFSMMQKDGLVAPLNFSAAVGETEQFQMCDRVGSYFNDNMQGGNLFGAAHYASCMGQLPLLPKESDIEGFLNVAQLENDNYYHGSNAAYASDFLSQPPVPLEESIMADSFLNVVQMENDNYYHGSNATCGLDTSYGQLHNGGLFYQDMETGGYDDNQ